VNNPQYLPLIPFIDMTFGLYIEYPSLKSGKYRGFCVHVWLFNTTEQTFQLCRMRS